MRQLPCLFVVRSLFREPFYGRAGQQRLQGRRKDKSDRCDIRAVGGRPLAKSAPVIDTSGTTIMEGAMSGKAKAALFVAMLMAACGAAHAQDYTADQQALCTGDAFRLCSSAIPDVDRVTACMVQKQAQLSPGCAQFFRPMPASTRKPAAKPRKARALKRQV
jgi:hypothetical protein